MAKNSDDLDKMSKQLMKQASLQKDINSSVDAYSKTLKEIADRQGQINHIAKQREIINKEEKENTKELLKLQKDELKGTEEDVAKRKKVIIELKKKIWLQKQSVALADVTIKQLEETNKEYIKAVNSVSRINMGLRATGKTLSKVPGLISKGFGKLKGTGIFEMDKAIRAAGVEMGIVSSAGVGIAKTLENAADQTWSMGVNVKDLAKMQSAYSSELGRSVRLSEDGLVAMSALAKGTGLGADGAANLVAQMDRFNISATDSVELLEESVNSSSKMGLNATKVLKNLQNNLKMANKYHFKGGVAGMAKMAATATKFGLSMETTASFADKVFNIEGAVEMAAKLNTMGGEWAKLGDPMKLMYQSTNDMEGLQESIIDATSGMADFNSETGEISFSGLEIRRMKELEKITGISADQMAEAAKAKRKFSEINAKLGLEPTDEMKEFIENTAVFKDGQFQIQLSGEDEMIPIGDLTKLQKDKMIQDSADLKQRAIDSQTFEDTLSNTVELAKQALLPALEGLNKALPDIRKMIKGMQEDGIFDGVKEAARTIGEVVGKAISFLSGFGSIISKAIIGGFVATGLLKMAMWVANGFALAKGFRMGTKGFGGGGSSSGGQYGAKGGQIGPAQAPKKMGMGKRLLGGNSKVRAGSIGSMGLGMGLGLGAMGLDSLRGGMDDPESTGGKWMGVGSSALAGAGMGAMLGPIGAAVGGLLGGIYGAVTEFNKPTGGAGVGKAGDVMSPAKGVTQISTKEGGIFDLAKRDDVVAAPGAVAALKNASGGGGGGGSSSKIHISFDDILVKSDDGVGKIDLTNDSAFMRELATKLKETMNASANGGVLSPNPS